MTIDTTTEFGTRIVRRLREEQIIWLVTVDGSQTPQPSPVWFYWDAQTILIYSKPHAPKLRNMLRTERVALNFNSGIDGDDVVIFTGTAQIVANPTPAHQVAPYREKYASGMANLGMTPEQFAATYSAAVHVTIDHTRGY